MNLFQELNLGKVTATSVSSTHIIEDRSQCTSAAVPSTNQDEEKLIKICIISSYDWFR